MHGWIGSRHEPIDNPVGSCLDPIPAVPPLRGARRIHSARFSRRSHAHLCVLWVLVAQLRKKIEPDPSQPRYLLSEPWVGYRLSTE